MVLETEHKPTNEPKTEEQEWMEVPLLVEDIFWSEDDPRWTLSRMERRT